jgi:hypothetical protein
MNNKLRKTENGYAHWCNGCEEMHSLPNSWKFNGNLENPTFTPSFLHSGFVREKIKGIWTGEWIRDVNGLFIPFVCHYVLTDGILNYCEDCTHYLRSKSIPLPEIPKNQ